MVQIKLLIQAVNIYVRRMMLHSVLLLFSCWLRCLICLVHLLRDSCQGYRPTTPCVCSHHFFHESSTQYRLFGCALSSWKMKPWPNAAIPRGIATGYKEMVTQMHSQTRWSFTLHWSHFCHFFPSTCLIWYEDLIWTWYSIIFVYLYKPIHSNFTRLKF